MQRQPSTIRRIFELVFLVALVVGALNYQFLLDQYALVSFKPSPAVGEIESRLALTTYARGVLYRSQPRIDEKAAFNADCQTSKGELELGCYYRDRVYILHISNSSLATEMDVVTAHELLHAAWMRLSSAEHDRLTVKLEEVYHNMNDPELKQRMAGYAQSEPGQEANELHSILATEQAQLTPELEKYYARYFQSRATIVAAHAQYESVFSSRRQELEQELAEIRGYKGQLAVINRQLDDYKRAGKIAQYNALVPRQNNLVDSINSRIEHYQQGVDEYNALSRSLDSQEITDTESQVQ